MKQMYINYLGSDVDFIDSFNTFLSSKSTAETQYTLNTHSTENELSLAQLLLEPVPSLIIADLTEPNVKFQSLLVDLAILKSHSFFKKIPIIGIFKDKEHLNQLKIIFNYGISYSFIKGHDFKLLLEDSFYLAFDDYDKSAQFAMVKFPGLPYTATAQGLLTTMTEERLSMDCDLEFSSADVSAAIPFLSSEVISIDIEERQNASFSSDCLFNYSFKIPYPGPWDEETEQAIKPEAVSDYISNHSCFFSKPRNLVLIDSSDPRLACEIITERTKLPFNLIFSSDNSLPDKVSLTKPSIIILSSLNSETYSLAQVIDAIKDKSDYNPIVFIFNSTESSDTLKSLYNYANIISNENPCSSAFVNEILLRYKKKLENSHYKENLEFSTFKLLDHDRIVGINCNIFVTSLTEHQITFLCNEKIPMFSHLKINVPVEGQLIIVPNRKVLANHATKGTHYTALIHGIEPQDSNILRKFINFCIYEPQTESYSLDSFNHYYAPKTLTKEELPEEEPVILDATNHGQQREPLPELPKRKSINGKSKL